MIYGIKRRTLSWLGSPTHVQIPPFPVQLVCVCVCVVCVRVCLNCRLRVCVPVSLLIAARLSRRSAPKLIAHARSLCVIVCSPAGMRVSKKMTETL